MDQPKPSGGEELVDIVRDGACALENSKLGHADSLGVFAAKSGTAIARLRPISRILTSYFTSFFTIYFTPFFTTYFTPFFIGAVKRSVKEDLKE